VKQTLSDRVQWLGPIAGLLVFGVAALVLHRELSQFKVADVVAYLGAIPRASVVGALTLTVVSYWWLGFYDALARELQIWILAGSMTARDRSGKLLGYIGFSASMTPITGLSISATTPVTINGSVELSTSVPEFTPSPYASASGYPAIFTGGASSLRVPKGFNLLTRVLMLLEFANNNAKAAAAETLCSCANGTSATSTISCVPIVTVAPCASGVRRAIALPST